MRAIGIAFGFLLYVQAGIVAAQTPEAPPVNPPEATPAAPPTTPPVTPPETTPAAPAPTLPIILGVSITGNTVVSTEDIRNVLTLKPGVPYKAEDYQRDADAIERLYTDRGYQALVEPFTYAADGIVQYRILESVVDTIQVRGNHKTRTATVLRVVRMKPGELYHRDQAQADVRALYNLGIFDDATYRLEPGSAPGKVNVVYTVDEAKTGEVAAGLSYSGSSGVIGQVAVQERNLGGRAQALGAFVQSGGKFFRSGFQLQLYNPFLDAHKSALDAGVYAKTVYRFTGNDLFSNQFDVGLGYDEFRTGGDLSYSRTVGLSRTLAYGFRGNGVKAHYAYEIPSLGFQEGRNPGIPDGSVYVGTLALADDHRDYIIDPGRGGIGVLALEAGNVRTTAQTFLVGSNGEGGPLTTTVPGKSGSISRFSADLRRYMSHGRTEKEPNKAVPVLAARLVAGSVGGDVPYWEQFFVGGIGLGGVRYARFLNAQNSYEDPFVTSSQALRGYTEGRFWGRHMLVGSLEYRFPIGQGARLGIFTDVGDAWGNDVKILDPTQTDPRSQDDSFKAHASVGLGLRVATPVGPIRIDWGVGSEGSRTHFSVGQVF